jgi:hypothetical protein
MSSFRVNAEDFEDCLLVFPYEIAEVSNPCGGDFRYVQQAFFVVLVEGDVGAIVCDSVNGGDCQFAYLGPFPFSESQLSISSSCSSLIRLQSPL